MYIAQMSLRGTRLRILYDPRDPMMELNNRDRVSRIYRCSHLHYRKKSMCRNTHFSRGKSANTVHLKHFSACNSHELQLFDNLVTIKGRGDE